MRSAAEGVVEGPTEVGEFDDLGGRECVGGRERDVGEKGVLECVGEREGDMGEKGRHEDVQSISHSNANHTQILNTHTHKHCHTVLS